MIERTTAFKIGDQVFETITDAQEHALKELIDKTEIQNVPGLLVEHADKVVDILTTTPNSKPSARKIHGGKKARKPQEPVTAAKEPVK